MYSFWKDKQHTILSITCIPRILLSCTSTLINQVNKMLWICSIQCVYNCISSFQSLQVLKSSDLKPYIVFVYPPNMEKLRQMQKNFYPDTTITVRNLSVLSFFFPSVFVCVCISLSHFVIDLQLVVHVITGNTYLIFNITCIFEHMDEKVQTKNFQLLKKVNCTGPM